MTSIHKSTYERGNHNFAIQLTAQLEQNTETYKIEEKFPQFTFMSAEEREEFMKIITKIQSTVK